MRTRLRYRSRQVLAPIGASVVLLLAMATATQAAFPGKDGRLVAVLANPGVLSCPGDAGPGDCGWQDTIETFRRDGSARDQLMQRTTRDGADRLHDVAWSPNGRQIAFIRGAQLGLMGADGSRRHLLRKGHFFGFYYNIAWAPDGRYLFLAGSSTENDYDGIYRVRTDGTDLRRLSRGADSDPAVSTTGEVAFARVIGGTSWIFVLRHPGKRATPLLPGADPDWSPNGKRLAFARDDGIWLCSATGNRRRHITNGHPSDDPRDRDHGPAWSPSGAWITFVRKPNLYLVRPDRTGLRRVPLTVQQGMSWDSPSWQPLH
jgi:Tol biopolymer transport system component